jgi:hypothetical protein
LGRKSYGATFHPPGSIGSSQSDNTTAYRSPDVIVNTVETIPVVTPVSFEGVLNLVTLDNLTAAHAIRHDTRSHETRRGYPLTDEGINDDLQGLR